ncbi:MAG: pyruvate ferredoxin oxidoreductase, partial [Methanosarcinales archaeon]
MKKMISGNEAAAWGARLARAEVIPTFPITPQTEIIENIAKWISNKEFDA